MTDEKNSKRRAAGKLPPMMSMRDFLRGGYQDITEPTVLLSRSAVYGTFIPGKIDSAYQWTPGAAPANSAPLIPSRADPAWLAGRRRTRQAQPATGESPDGRSED